MDRFTDLDQLNLVKLAYSRNVLGLGQFPLLAAADTNNDVGLLKVVKRDLKIFSLRPSTFV